MNRTERTLNCIHWLEDGNNLRNLRSIRMREKAIAVKGGAPDFKLTSFGCRFLLSRMSKKTLPKPAAKGSNASAVSQEINAATFENVAHVEKTKEAFLQVCQRKLGSV